MLRIERVHDARLVTEEHRARRFFHFDMRIDARMPARRYLRRAQRLRCAKFTDRDGRVHGRGGRGSPVAAARARIERIHMSGRIADKQSPVHDARRSGIVRAGKSVGPLEGESGDIGGAQRRFRLVAGIIRVPAPAIPLGRANRHGPRVSVTGDGLGEGRGCAQGRSQQACRQPPISACRWQRSRAGPNLCRAGADG